LATPCETSQRPSSRRHARRYGPHPQIADPSPLLSRSLRGPCRAGDANKIVADSLHVSEESVKAHLRCIVSKLGAHSRTQAVTIALKRGIIEM